MNKGGGHNFVAMRIAIDKEIVFDYAMRNYSVDFFPPKCNCGSEKCRGRITGWKDLPEATRKTYQGYTAPYLLKLDKKYASDKTNTQSPITMNDSPAPTTISTLYEKLATEEKKFNRQPQSVNLLAVSKTRTPEEILAVAAQGQINFGENYIQESLEKVKTLAKHKLIWHFIGAIQSNKTADIAKNFDWVHTVEREKIAQRLNDQRPDDLPPLNVCIEVNISGEDTKSGISLEELPALAKCINDMPRLCLRGLMALPAPTDDFEAQRKPFQQLAEALQQLQSDGLKLDTLSIGTTADYKAAIAEGATIVRLGTAVFGARPAKKL